MTDSNSAIKSHAGGMNGDFSLGLSYQCKPTASSIAPLEIVAAHLLLIDLPANQHARSIGYSTAPSLTTPWLSEPQPAPLQELRSLSRQAKLDVKLKRLIG